MPRHCERPECAEPARVEYRFDAGRQIVFFDHLREGDPLAAGALCNRHAEVMVLPRGWSLDDRRLPAPTLFAMRPSPAGRPMRRRASRSNVGGVRPSGAQILLRPVRNPDPAERAGLDSEVPVGPAPSVVPAPVPAPVDVPVVHQDDTPAWRPDFDETDDLDGLLDAKSPLLSRAFRAVPTVPKRRRPRR